MAYFEDNFEEKNNSINQLLYLTTFEQQPPDFEYLNYQIHIWIAVYQLTETFLETEKESYQTAPVFDLFSNESEHFTQTVTPEPMAQDPLQQNILIVLQDIAIELAQRIEDNQRIHLESTLSVFASASIMASALQMTAIFFTVQTQDLNKQLIDRLTVNLVWLLEPLTQAVRNNQQFQRPRFEPCFNQSQQPPYQRQQNHGPPVCYCCGLTGHFSRDCAPPKGKSASQPKKNPFYAFNLIDNDHNMDKLAINTSKSTRKKKKTKVDFVLDLNKASKSSADNNKPPKTKVFKNSPKLEPPEIVQKSGPYSVVKDLMETPAHIIFGQLMTHPQFRKDLHKSLIPKKKIPKTNKCFCQAGLADNNNVIPLICKAQVAGYFIDLILDSESSVSVIAKHFLEAIGRKIDESSTQLMTNIHSNKKKGLGIAKAVPVQINGISIETNMEMFEAKEYTIIVGNEWLKKAKVLLDYEFCELTIRCGEKPIVVKCYHWTTSSVLKQSQEEEQSDESDDEENDEEDEQKEQEETAKLAYTIFTSNDKPLDNVKADKERIMVNGKLICWPYYNILRRTFDQSLARKPNTAIGDMAFVSDANAINLCIRQIMNTNSA
ncbi:hypothetical protein G9A89_007491 [Geosiphon pyriformis]|nr:hypothetical protein G9A89_007491 [Geosiphon pyriformis]